MKKLMAILSAAIMVIGFAGCGAETDSDSTSTEAETQVQEQTQEESSVSTADIMNQINSEGYLPDDRIELTANDMLDYYGIDSSEIKQCSAVQNSSGWQDELVIIEATDSSAAADVTSHLNERINNQRDAMKNYDATMYDIVSNCEVVTSGNYVAMFITANYEECNSIFNSYFA